MEEPLGPGNVARISERLEKSLCMDTEERLEMYNRLTQEGKEAARGGDMHQALQLFKQAFNIHPSDKLRSRIQKIEELLAENESEDEEEFVDVNSSGLLLFKELHNKLYDYQKQGVAFLYSLYRDKRKGGILADDMGLGKTIQVISFLSGMYDAEHVKTTILVVPTSLITNWIKEFAKWTPGMRVKEFHSTSVPERMRNLEKIQRRGGVLITTYTMLLHNWQILASYQGREFMWDYMILDEAHKIKSSSTKTAKSAYAIPSKNRVLLTGTPVQNNLREMWALFDFACHGMLLGTAKTFKMEYENPITRAREKDATPGEKALGLRMSENLMAIIKPYFLRRTKAEVQKPKPNSPVHENGSGSENPERVEKSCGTMMPTLTRKNDLIVWTYLSEVQEDIYRKFLSLDQIKELLMTTKSPLAQLTILKKLCDHPRLLSIDSMAKLGVEGQETGESATDSGHDFANVSDNSLISESGKMVFLFSLLERLREEGHRTLIFARYRKVLDIIERILNNRGFKVMRMDGTIIQTAERERRITLFQKDHSYTVFLLTTQVGGVGITLTAANRVIIYDPSWNPATDAQAVDRAYRIGQKDNVVIYRLITCGTVEEKIYRRQVFKDSLIRQNTGDKKNPFRYFSKQELKELFTLEDTRSSTTQLQLQALHSRQRRTDAELDEHIAHLHTMEMFGISDHDLMFSVTIQQEEVPEDQEEHRYIEGRVQKAQELMIAESELQKQLAQNVASSTEAAWLRIEQQPQERRQKSPRQKSPRQKTESPPVSPRQLSPEVVDLENSSIPISVKKDMIDLTVVDSENSSIPISVEKDMIDLTTEETSEHIQEESNKLLEKNCQNVKTKQNFNGQEVVISDDEITSENGFHREEETQFSLNEDRSMNCLEKNNEKHAKNNSVDYFQGLQNGNCSINNLVIKDSINEKMDTSVQNLKQNRSLFENISTTGVLDSVVDEQMPKVNCKCDQSTRDDCLSFFTKEDGEKLQVNSFQKNKTDLSICHSSPVKNKRLSALQVSLKTQNSSKSSQNGLESFGGDFNLQLDEDSDMFSDNDIFNDVKETEVEEQQMLSKLQLHGSFDVNKSLAEHHNREKSMVDDVSMVNASVNESVVFTSRKKRVGRIYSDDEEQEQGQNETDFEGSFHMLGTSTPKTAVKLNRSVNPQGTEPKVVNTSVASRRSFALSLIDNLGNSEEQESGGGIENGQMLNSKDEESQVSEKRLHFQESGSHFSEAEESEPEETEESDTEPSGETLHSEAEMEEETQDSMDQLTTNTELSSNEQMEGFTAESSSHIKETTGGGEEDYDWLAQRGREYFHQGKQEEALSYFLRAIDLKAGDPEIQLLTIQLYRQLSQKK